MSRDQIPPTRTVIGSIHEDYREDHPAFAMIGASRWSAMGAKQGDGTYLFGTDFRHQNYVVITVQGAMLSRSIAHDWIHSRGGEPHMIEIALSEAQWATFVSTMNVGEGVPGTLMSHDGEQIPGILPTTDRRAQFNAEVGERLQHSVELIREMAAAIAASSLSAKAKAELRAKADKAAQELDSNLAYAAKAFDQHAEKTVEHAKIEVAAYVTSAIQRAGIAALTGGSPVLELTDGDLPVDGAESEYDRNTTPRFGLLAQPYDGD